MCDLCGVDHDGLAGMLRVGELWNERVLAKPEPGFLPFIECAGTEVLKVRCDLVAVEEGEDLYRCRVTVNVMQEDMGLAEVVLLQDVLADTTGYLAKAERIIRDAIPVTMAEIEATREAMHKHAMAVQEAQDRFHQQLVGLAHGHLPEC